MSDTHICCWRLVRWAVVLTFLATLTTQAATPNDEQMQDLSQTQLLDAVRAVMARDPFPALVTVDVDGQPRVRTVEIRPPDDSLVIWFATKPNTRKVAQIRNNPRVTLYFSADGEGSYVSVMGRASVHDDLATINRMSWREVEVRAQFWPDYPQDYVLVRVRPEWLEVLSPNVAADPVTWAPQQILMSWPESVPRSADSLSGSHEKQSTSAVK